MGRIILITIVLSGLFYLIFGQIVKPEYLNSQEQKAFQEQYEYYSRQMNSPFGPGGFSLPNKPANDRYIKTFLPGNDYNLLVKNNYDEYLLDSMLKFAGAIFCLLVFIKYLIPLLLKR